MPIRGSKYRVFHCVPSSEYRIETGNSILRIDSVNVKGAELLKVKVGRLEYLPHEPIPTLGSFNRATFFFDRAPTDIILECTTPADEPLKLNSGRVLFN